jgi:hypothetical protein
MMLGQWLLPTYTLGAKSVSIAPPYTNSVYYLGSHEESNFNLALVLIRIRGQEAQNGDSFWFYASKITK